MEYRLAFLQRFGASTTLEPYNSLILTAGQGWKSLIPMRQMILLQYIRCSLVNI